MKKWLLLPYLIALVMARADGSPSTNRVLDNLIGRWVLSGTIAGKQTTHDVSAEWVLNHGYVRIHEISREKKPDNQPAYEAFVFISFEPSANEYSCLWLDSTSSAGLSPEGIGHAKVNNNGTNAIPFIFKDSAGHITFENTFVYDVKSDSWEWVMTNVQDNKRVPFGHVKLVVQKSP